MNLGLACPTEGAFLPRSDEVKVGDIRKGYHVNSEQALIIESSDSGEQRLYTKPECYFPSASLLVAKLAKLLKALSLSAPFFSR